MTQVYLKYLRWPYVLVMLAGISKLLKMSGVWLYFAIYFSTVLIQYVFALLDHSSVDPTFSHLIGWLSTIYNRYWSNYFSVNTISKHENNRKTKPKLGHFIQFRNPSQERGRRGILKYNEYIIAEWNPHLQILLAAGLDATPYRLKDTGAVAFRGFRWNQWVMVRGYLNEKKDAIISFRSFQYLILRTFYLLLYDHHQISSVKSGSWPSENHLRNRNTSSWLDIIWFSI